MSALTVGVLLANSSTTSPLRCNTALPRTVNTVVEVEMVVEEEEEEVVVVEMAAHKAQGGARGHLVVARVSQGKGSEFRTPRERVESGLTRIWDKP